LPCPPADLAFEIVARLAVVGKADVIGAHTVQRRQGIRHAHIDAAPFFPWKLRQGAIAEHPAIDALHQVEGRTDQFGILVKQDGRRHGHVGRRQCLQHAVFPFDGMRARQDLAGRLLAQHHAAPAEGDEIGRVRLTAADPLQFERRRPFTKTVDEETVQGRRIEIHASRHAHIRTACRHPAVPP